MYIRFLLSSIKIYTHLCIYSVFMETLNAHAPTTLTKDASSLFIRPPPSSVDGSGVLHVVEVF